MARASLIITKSEFEKTLETLIADGESILRSAPIPNDLYANLGNREYDNFGYHIRQVEDFKKRYNMWHGICMEFLESAFDDDQNKYKKGFVQIGNILVATTNTDWTKVNIEDLSSSIDYLKNLKAKLIYIIEKTMPAANTTHTFYPSSGKEAGINVFIVHGHNELMKEKMARTLVELGLKPIILHEQANGGRTIIEKLEREADKTSFAVVLLTADDISDGKFRARQNVVLELGLFIGKLGRDHVMALMEKEVEKPGDIDGLVYTIIDNGNEWKRQLVKELRHAGFNVSADALS